MLVKNTYKFSFKLKKNKRKLGQENTYSHTLVQKIIEILTTKTQSIFHITRKTLRNNNRCDYIDYFIICNQNNTYNDNDIKQS